MANMSSTGTWTLKIELNGEIRRQRNWPETGIEPSIESLRAAASTLFVLAPSEADSVSIKYKDEVGYLCTLTEETLPDLLHRCCVLRLVAVVASTPASTPTANDLPMAVVHKRDTHESEGAAGSSIAQLAAALLSQHLPEDISPAAYDKMSTTEDGSAAVAGQPAAGTLHSNAFAKGLQNGVGHFIEQVASDCQTTCSGIVSAFRAPHSAAEKPRDATNCIDGGKDVQQDWKDLAAVAAGVAVAAQLAPGPLKGVAVGVAAGLAVTVATTRLMALDAPDNVALPASSQEAETGELTESEEFASMQLPIVTEVACADAASDPRSKEVARAGLVDDIVQGGVRACDEQARFRGSERKAFRQDGTEINYYLEEEGDDDGRETMF